MPYPQKILFELTKEEVFARHEQKRAAEKVVEEAELKLAAAKADHKSVVACQEELIGKLKSAIDTEHEFREVQCEDRPDFSSMEMLTYRLDTERVIHRRPLYPEERQGHLVPLDGGKSKASGETGRKRKTKHDPDTGEVTEE